MKRERFRFGEEILSVGVEFKKNTLTITPEEGEPISFPILLREGATTWVAFKDHTLPVTVARSRDGVHIHCAGEVITLGRVESSWEEGDSGGAFDGRIKPPMPGTVVKVLVGKGDEVEKGTPLLIIESMKMEHPVTAPVDGTITAVRAAEGEGVDLESIIVEMVQKEA